MPGRIVLYGATGYTGALTARALLARGAQPVLAGRDRDRLSALAAELSGTRGARATGGVGTARGVGGASDAGGRDAGGRDAGDLGGVDSGSGANGGPGRELETVVAPSDDPAALRALIGPGDVLVSTAGPFLKCGRSAVAAAVAAGAAYLDSTGEAPFIRRVFEEFGPRAQKSGAVLLTAFGYDYVPGNLAGALALRAAGPSARRLDIGYFVRGDMRAAASAGTRASAAGVAFESGHTFRDGRIVAQRTAAGIASFEVAGQTRQAFSVGASEQFGLPRLRLPAPDADAAAERASLTDVNVYLGWYGAATRVIHHVSPLIPLLGRVPGLRIAVDGWAGGIQRRRTRPGGAEGLRSDVVAVASDAHRRMLAQVHLTGGDPYSFTAGILAWAACRISCAGIGPAGALGPVEAFGIDALEAGCASAGISRRPSSD
jgi:short subunit dehydrogenase-like uncharacterized protein